MRSGSVPALAQCVAMICGVGCRHSSDPVLLWLWRRPVATALIGPLTWEPPYAAAAAQEIAKKRPKKKKNGYDDTFYVILPQLKKKTKK